VLAKAAEPSTADAPAAATREAKARGVFGSASFVTREELFWGDDRMEDAIEWSRRGTLAR
jgi:2-hydroxychromene-2-carboxylate isomerase